MNKDKEYNCQNKENNMNRWTDISDNEKYINVSDLKNRELSLFHNIYWAVRRFFRDIPYNIRKVKWFWQRGKRGYADCDVWSMGDYLADIIPSMLRQLKEINCGYPGNLTEEKWDKLLDEMIIGFSAAKRVYDDEYDLGTMITDCIADQKLFREKMKIFTKYFFNLWD